MKDRETTACINIEMFPFTVQSSTVTLPQLDAGDVERVKKKKIRRQLSTSLISSRWSSSNNSSKWTRSMASLTNSPSSRLSSMNLLYIKSLNKSSRLQPPRPVVNSRSFRAKNNKDKEKTEVFTYLDRPKEIYKVSYPCYSGCATCTFTNCIGPVKVHVSQFRQPKEMLVNELRDGQGRAVIPRSRRKEFRGLIYDKQTHSLYPPLPRGYISSYFQENGGGKRFY